MFHFKSVIEGAFRGAAVFAALISAFRNGRVIDVQIFTGFIA